MERMCVCLCNCCQCTYFLASILHQPNKALNSSLFSLCAYVTRESIFIDLFYLIALTRLWLGR